MYHLSINMTTLVWSFRKFYRFILCIFSWFRFVNDKFIRLDLIRSQSIEWPISVLEGNLTGYETTYREGLPIFKYRKFIKSLLTAKAKSCDAVFIWNTDIYWVHRRDFKLILWNRSVNYWLVLPKPIFDWPRAPSS